MNITLLEKSVPKGLTELVNEYQFKPYQEYEIENSRLVSYVIDDISKNLSSKDNFSLVAEKMGELVGLVSLEKLDWDTKHFGIQMAKIEYLIAKGEYSDCFELKSALLSNLLTKCSERGIIHLTARVHTEDISSIHALESSGFRIMDTRIMYSLDLRRKRMVHEPVSSKTSCCVRQFKQNDVDKLANIALESFKGGRVATDRFHADPSLSREKSDQLYVKWVVNSCQGLADAVFVSEIDGIPVGYITCKVYNLQSQKLGVRFGSMIISAVSLSARQKGVYNTMFDAGLRWLADRVDIVEVGTQIGNYLVQRVWTKFGFVPNRSQHTLVRASTA